MELITRTEEYRQAQHADRDICVENLINLPCKLTECRQPDQPTWPPEIRKPCQTMKQALGMAAVQALTGRIANNVLGV